MESPLTSKLQQQSSEFAEYRGYELVDLGVYAKTGWEQRESFYGIQMGLNLLNGHMGLILVWVNQGDFTACSIEIDAENLRKFRGAFDVLDAAIESIDKLRDQSTEVAA